MGWYGVFFKEIGPFQDAINGAVGGWGDSQFCTFPFNGRDADLGIGVFFQLDPDFLDQVFKIRWGFMRKGMGSSGLLLEPLFLSGLVPVQPFEEPGFGSPQFLIDRDRFFAVEVLFNCHFSQGFFVHRFLSWVDLVGRIIEDFNPRVNDVVAL